MITTQQLSRTFSVRDVADDLTRLRKDWVSCIPIVLVTLALLAGKIDVGRLIPTGIELVAEIELRFVFLFFAGVVWWFADRAPGPKTPGRLALVFAAFVSASILHAFVFYQNAYTTKYLLDFATLLIMLLILVACYRSELHRRMAAATILAVALGLCLLGFLGALDGDNSQIGWSPLGTTISFVRIAFFGILAVSYLMAVYRSGHFWFGVILFVLGYGAIASSMKVAFVFLGAWAFGLVVVALSTQKLRSLAMVCSAIVVLFAGAGASFVIEDTRVFDRFRQAVGSYTTLPAPLTREEVEEVTPADPAEQLDLEALASDVFPGRVLPWGCIALPDPSRLTVYDFVRQGVDADSWECVFIDRTARMAFAIEAVRQFIENPILGAGFGSFFMWTYEYDEFQYRYPHSVPLEILAAGGLPLFALFAVLVGLFLFTSIVDAQRNGLGSAFPFMIGMLAAASVGGDFYDMRYFFFAALIFISPIGGSETTSKEAVNRVVRHPVETVRL
ncbi:O-antigen ligase family protein [Oceaniradius stylonematis]|uniref:O-antigen ligase family protein n=1 Tax=Oceaniradius stylonematis TaxID=2184161 RepID=UPI003C7E866B